MVRGTFDAKGRPYVLARVLLPGLHSGNVPFLFDTGADHTVLMPKDAAILGVDYDGLPDPDETLGVGGTAEISQEDVDIVFADSEVRVVYVYRMPVRILLPSGNPSEMRLPSLLGRDIINRWRIVYDQSVPELSAEVLASDAKYDLSS